MKENVVQIEYPKIGICGLSCRLCPSYHTEAKSRCLGCKSKDRIVVGCPFITCALKKKGVEFCWDCEESETCEKWKKHRETGKKADSFKCYQKLEEDIAFIQNNSVAEFERIQVAREELLKEMLQEFNEGRSKSYYCIVSTVLEIGELRDVLIKARQGYKGMDIKEKSKLLHAIIDEIAERNSCYLKLRK